MDSQHRHELQTSEFAKLLQKLNRFLEQHGNRISIGICVVTALIVAGILWQRSTRAKEQVAWSQLSVAANPDDLADVWKQNPDAAAAPWARLLEAEQRLSQGVQSMFLDVEAGKSDLEKARANFEKLSEQSSAPREVRERALFGLARAEESLSDGASQEAAAVYKRFLERFPDSFFKDDVKQRLAALSAGGSGEFYQWFAKFDRPKTKDQTPRDTGASGNLELDSLLEAARQSGLDSLGKPAQDEPAKEGDEAAPEMDADGETQSGLTVPDDAEAEPALPAEPAAETPAEPAQEAAAGEESSASPAEENQ